MVNGSNDPGKIATRSIVLFTEVFGSKYSAYSKAVNKTTALIPLYFGLACQMEDEYQRGSGNEGTNQELT